MLSDTFLMPCELSVVQWDGVGLWHVVAALRLQEVAVLHLGQWGGVRRSLVLCVLHLLLSGGQAMLLWFHAQARE